MKRIDRSAIVEHSAAQIFALVEDIEAYPRFLPWCVAATVDERDAAVKAMLAMAIRACRKHGKYVGICGQGPSDHPDLARWLMEQGIDSLSLNPDTVVSTWLSLAEAAPQKQSAAA